MFNNYISASARIRALESKALSQKDIERMLNAKTPKDTFNVLQDNSFSEHMLGVGYKDFENVLIKYLNKVKKTIILSCPNGGVISLISIWYDFYNIKIALKAFLKGENFENILKNLSTLGAIEFKDIKDFAYEGKSIGENFSKLRAQVINDYQTNNKIQRVDILCDKEMFRCILEITKKLGSEIITNFYLKKIDAVNILSYLRNKENFNKEIFIEGGSLNCSTLLSGNTEEIYIMMKNKLGLDIDIKKQESFAKIGAYIDDVLTKTLQQTKFMAYGQEIIFAFFWSQIKSTEVIRAIMVGKINHLSRKDIELHMKML